MTSEVNASSKWSEIHPWYGPVDSILLQQLPESNLEAERPTASYWSTWSDSELEAYLVETDDFYSIPEGTALYSVDVIPVGYPVSAEIPEIELTDTATEERWKAKGFFKKRGKGVPKIWMLAPHRPDSILVMRARFGGGHGALLIRPGFFQPNSVGSARDGRVWRRSKRPDRSKYSLTVLCFDHERSTVAGNVQVQHADGIPVPGAAVVRNGQVLGMTDAGGISGVYRLPDDWSESALSTPESYAVWKHGYTPRFLRADVFENQSAVHVELSTREVFVSGQLTGRLPDAAQLRFERNAYVKSDGNTGDRRTIAFITTDWQFTDFRTSFLNGPFDPFQVMLSIPPEGATKATQDNALRHNAAIRPRIDELTRASGQVDPNWDDFQRWYGRTWRLEGSNFSAVLPFAGRFGIVIGRNDPSEAYDSNPAHPIESHFVEVTANGTSAPAFVLHASD
ncbi:MAG: hypothetical protein M5U25_15675 [Planctomycetota bacterium]|nr:hypothetical protein [Planctomycetota bacterium]